MNEGDLLRSLRLRSLADAPDAFGQSFWEARDRPPADWEAEARRSSQGDAHAWFVARVGDADVGTILGRRRRPDTLLVFSMWVDPDHRGLGIGRRLVAEVEAWGVSWGATNILLWVFAENEGAVRFYERLGFRTEPAGPDAEAGATHEALAMRRPIPRERR